MMVLIESWRESFRLLMPKQAKILLLVTMKCLRGPLHSPWAYGIIIPLAVGISFSMVYGHYPFPFVVQLAISLLINALIVLLLLLLRPSVMIKHRYYFMNYQRHILYVVVFHGLINLIRLLRPFAVPGWSWLIWAPLSSFWLLFFIDSHATLDAFVRSFVRALLMLVYNLPVCLVVTGLWYVVFVGVSQWPIIFIGRYLVVAQHFWQFLLGAIVGRVLFPAWYALITNIYVKQLHEQFGLYFGRLLEQ